MIKQMEKTHSKTKHNKYTYTVNTRYERKHMNITYTATWQKYTIHTYTKT